MITNLLITNKQISLIVTDAPTLYKKFSVEIEVCPIFEFMLSNYKRDSTLFVLTSIRNIKAYKRYKILYEAKK